jgi:hypothetical protein
VPRNSTNWQPCAVCGREFYAKPTLVERGLARYCSPEHAAQSQRAARVILACAACGKAIEVPDTAPGRRRRFCDRACWRAGRRRAREAAWFWRRGVRVGECLEWPGVEGVSRYHTTGWFGQTIYVHRLAYALAHGLRIADLPDVVRHVICHNPACYAPAHLVAGTHKENYADMVRDGRRHQWAKLQPDDVRAIRAGLAADVTGRELARRYGVSEASITRIKNGRGWQGVT